MAGKYYVVWAGYETGIYSSWDECKAAVDGFPGARYKSYGSRQEAIEAYRGNPDEELGLFKAMARRKAEQVNHAANPEIKRGAIAVDAACSGNPGPVEYQGVDIDTGARIFHVGPLQGGSNNLGEFLALVHALAWLSQRGLGQIPIYTDSRTALAWVRNRHARTAIKPDRHNTVILDMVRRAENWLKNNTPTNPVLKWDTERWGEIPADFGRK